MCIYQHLKKILALMIIFLTAAVQPALCEASAMPEGMEALMNQYEYLLSDKDAGGFSMEWTQLAKHYDKKGDSYFYDVLIQKDGASYPLQMSLQMAENQQNVSEVRFFCKINRESILQDKVYQNLLDGMMKATLFLSDIHEGDAEKFHQLLGEMQASIDQAIETDSAKNFARLYHTFFSVKYESVDGAEGYDGAMVITLIFKALPDGPV